MIRLLSKIICLIFGHRYQVAQEFSNVSRRVVCADCRGDWAMHDGERVFVPWDEDFANFYRDRGHIVHNPWPNSQP